MNRDDVIEKVQKLLSLASSPNEHEAAVAAAKAHELLTRYNLSIEDVDQSRLSEEYGVVEKDNGRLSEPLEDFYIFALLHKFFYVKVITNVRRSAYYSDVWSSRKGRMVEKKRFRAAGYKFQLVGRKHNVQVARYVYDFLFRSFRSSFAALCEKVGVQASAQNAMARKSYYHGLFLGLKDQLEASLQSALAKEQQVALREDPNIKRFIDENFDDLQEAKHRPTDVHEGILLAGMADGQKMKIAPAIEAPTDQGQILALEGGTGAVHEEGR